VYEILELECERLSAGCLHFIDAEHPAKEMFFHGGRLSKIDAVQSELAAQKLL
jgi:hypothetical protein